MTRVVEGDRRQTGAPKVMSDVMETVQSTQPESSSVVTEYILAVLVPLVNIHGHNLGERDCLTLMCLSRMLTRNLIDPLLALAVIVHLACLKNLSLAQRRIVTINVLNEDSERQLSQCIAHFSGIATGLLENAQWRIIMEEHHVKCDIEDLIDGRILNNVFYSLQRGGARLLGQTDIRKEFEYLWALLGGLSNRELLLQPHRLENTEQPLPVEDPPDIKTRLLPFSSPIFDKHLNSIRISIEELASNDHQQYVPKISRETSHWHNRRPFDLKKAKVADKPLSKWHNPLRANQKYMAEMTAYAASLTNTKGKTLTPDLITLSASKETSDPKSKDPKYRDSKSKDPRSKDIKGKKDSKLSKADQIIADNKAKKGNVDRLRAISSWDEVRRRLDKLEPEMKYLETMSYYSRLDDGKAAILQVEVEIYRLQALLYQWAALCKNGEKDEGYGIVALVWNIMRTLNSQRVEMTKAAATYLESVSSLLGLPKPEAHSNVLDHRMSFQLQLPQATPGTLSIGIPPQEFQLTFCGPYMDRNTDARPDSRVTSFEPDGWQRKVLDELDADHSIFVVAPTSAGKTFISFYAMEKVLRESDNGIIVYVAPTKALVNQVSHLPPTEL